MFFANCGFQFLTGQMMSNHDKNSAFVRHWKGFNEGGLCGVCSPDAAPAESGGYHIHPRIALHSHLARPSKNNGQVIG
jgi:hypothetical protein